MEHKEDKLKRKLQKAKDNLVKAEVEYKKLIEAQKNYEYYKARVEKITKLLSGL